MADAFSFLHHPEQVLAENFPNVCVAIALAHQGLGNLWKMRAIFHTVRHIGSIKIRTQSDMIRTHEFYRMIDVVHDAFPAYVRQLSFRGGLFIHRRNLPVQAFRIIAAFFLELVKLSNHAPEQFFRDVLKALIDKKRFTNSILSTVIHG